LNTPVIIYGVAESYKAKRDEDGYQPSNLISSGFLPASVTFGIELVGDYMLVGKLFVCVTILFIS